jgi:leucyl/phenylalanyl-tRNA---protein transferase
VQEITPELLLNAYASGYFPMAESRDGSQINWYYPEERGIIPLDTFHIPASLEKFLKRDPFTYTTNQCFGEVIRSCAHRNDGTWINDTIIDAYCKLHELGFAHSVECWKDKNLVGGLYGVALGGAFFGESMFTRESNASKAALVHLVGLLNQAGYTLLDTQFVNDHLKQFGVVEIPRAEYLKKLGAALHTSPSPAFR